MTDPKKKRRRFDFLEGGKKADEPGKGELPAVGRFEHLEIGGLRPAAKPPAEAAAKTACPLCGQLNESERETCWACHKPLRKKEKPAPKPVPMQEVTLVLDGLTYVSTDPNLPGDIRELMDRIAKHGYSQKLLEEWQEQRYELRNKRPDSPPAAERGGSIEAFQGARISVIKLDGKVYLSDAKDLPPRIRQLFEYIDRNGVTPELMENLRGMGREVQFRPATTVQPSNGDIAFWRDVEALRQDDARLRPPSWRPSLDMVLRLYYYLAPAWLLVETISWPFFRAGVVTGGSWLGGFLFYAVEAAIGAGYWTERPWARRAAMVENALYLLFAASHILATPFKLASLVAHSAPESALSSHRLLPSPFGTFLALIFLTHLLRQQGREQARA